MIKTLLTKKTSNYKSVINKFLIDNNYHQGFYYLNNKPVSNEIFISYSHKDDLLFIAISDQEVGVDIEKITSMPPNIFFSKAENALDNLDKIKLWTIKEAIIKLENLNLRDMINIDINNYDYLTSIDDNYIMTIVYKKIC